MATTPVAPDSDLRNRLLGEPGVTPEDTQSELLQDGEDKWIRANLRGDLGVAPEDTHSELLASLAKEQRKAGEAASMLAERVATARAWTIEQAQERAARDVADHSSLVALGKRGDGDAFYLRSDMARQASASSAYDAALKVVAPELHARVRENEKDLSVVNVAAVLAASAKDSGAQPVPAQAAQDQIAIVDKGLKLQLEDNLRRRMAREQADAGQGLNSVDVQRSGKELGRGDFMMPRRVTQAYTEVDGKFFSKETNRPMFEDKGEKLATATTDKVVIGDMVALAKAKQWDSFKLTGSQEFRREAWLQAESQGIKTQGYTPKLGDLAQLEALRQDRATNTIIPLQERPTSCAVDAERATGAAPRHDLNKNQALMHVEATSAIASNLNALRQQPGMSDKSSDDLTKLAYWRGIVAEQNKLQPKSGQDEALARFDAQAADPGFLKRLNQETEAGLKDKTVERVQRRDTHEQSL